MSDGPLTERQADIIRWLAANPGSHTATDIAYGLGLHRVAVHRAGSQWSGQMSPAQHVIGSLTSLRRTHELVGLGRRRDGRSGTAYGLTPAGVRYVEQRPEAPPS